MALFVFIGVFAAMPSSAEDANNIRMDVYTFSPEYQYPERSPELLTPCVTTYASSIYADWGGGDILGCGSDFVAIRYTGTMTFASDTPVQMMAIADDGFSLSLDGVMVIDDWWLKGCSGSVVTFEPVAGHEYVLDAWFYEYGGGACSTLYMAPADNSEPWMPVEPSAFVPVPVIEPEPSPTPPEPEPSLIPEPTPTYAPEPQPEPQPEPEPTEEPIQPSPEPEPQPSELPAEPTPAPSRTQEPQLPVEEQPSPPVVEEPSIAPPVEVVEETILTQEDVIESLVMAAEQDDPELPAELAAIPLLGEALGAALEVFNDIGNIGSDMTPEVREKAQEAVVASVIVGQVATSAASAAASASMRRNK